MSANYVHDRIKCAFLVQEQKIIVNMLKAESESESCNAVARPWPLPCHGEPGAGDSYQDSK